MSCRCKDISKAEADKGKIHEAMSDLSDTITYYREVMGEHDRLFLKQRNAFYLEEDEFHTIEGKVKRRDEEVVNRLEAYRNYLSGELDRLARAVNSMQSEDDDYHDDDDDGEDW